MNNKPRIIIRSSAAEFLTFIAASGEGSGDAIFADGTVWLTERMMAEIFDTDNAVIYKHVRKYLDHLDFQELSSSQKSFTTTTSDGRQYSDFFYSLDAIIAVGYRVKSHRASRFRKWATSNLKNYIIEGYTMDSERLKMGGTILWNEYFEHQLSHIELIRLSSRRPDQRITDLFETALDYDKDDAITRRFYAKVIKQMTKPLLGEATDCFYTKDDMSRMERLLTAYLDMAEKMAHKKIPMTMEDWETRLNRLVNATKQEILRNDRKLSAEIGRWHEDSEFERYSIIKDRLYDHGPLTAPQQGSGIGVA